MIILDTNVVSETMRPRPNQQVITWLDRQAPNELYLCAPVLAEIRYGVARLKASDRKTKLTQLCTEMATQIFDGRVLSFDAVAAKAYGSILAAREAKGRPMTVVDAMIAAIAKSSNAVLATRNVVDFELIELSLINPFQAE